jgi:hypothetical protein
MNWSWKKTFFGLAICLLYIPMVFMAVNTFFPKITDTCYDSVYTSRVIASPVPEKLNETEMALREAEMRECYKLFEAEQIKYDGWKLILIMIINIVAASLILLNLEKSVRYGLFFGIVITAFAATIRYINSRSIPGFVLLVFLFGFIIYLVNLWKKD